MDTVAHVFAGIMICLYIVAIIASVFSIGKERKPLTAGTVVTSAILTYITIMLLFWAYFRA